MYMRNYRRANVLESATSIKTYSCRGQIIHEFPLIDIHFKY